MSYNTKISKVRFFDMSKTTDRKKFKRGMRMSDVTAKTSKSNNSSAFPATFFVECGDCCKRISNIDYFDFGIFPSAVVLVPVNNENLLVEVICDGKVIEKQYVSTIAVPIKNECLTFA